MKRISVKEPILRERASIPARLEHAAFGRSLRRLRDLQKESPQMKTVLLLLPLNRQYYRKIGLKPAPHEDRLVNQTRRLMRGVRCEIHVVRELTRAELFTDRVHYTARGRAILARRIFQAMKSLD